MAHQKEDSVARWYVIHTYSGYENKVKTDLEKMVKNRELEELMKLGTLLETQEELQDLLVLELILYHLQKKKLEIWDLRKCQ